MLCRRLQRGKNTMNNIKDQSISRFLDDIDCVTQWPKKNNDKLLVLKYLQGKFEINNKYSEIEVNTILNKWHTFKDHALLRRELFNKYLLNRTPDCRVYWVNTESNE